MENATTTRRTILGEGGGSGDDADDDIINDPELPPHDAPLCTATAPQPDAEPTTPDPPNDEEPHMISRGGNSPMAKTCFRPLDLNFNGY